VNIGNYANKVKTMTLKKAKTASSSKKSSSAKRSVSSVVAEIPEQFLLTTVEQLKSISVPVRLKILQAMAARPMTTKQVALQLGEPITKLYRHVDALENAGLLVLVEEVPKRGTVQKFFRAAAKVFKADDSCFQAKANKDARSQTLIKLLDTTRQEITRSMSEKPNDFPSAAGASLIELDDPSQVHELMEAIAHTIATWKKPKRSKSDAKATQCCRVAIFIHPHRESAS
jgi:DNA-binding transcriptional ArsR family regulator